MVKMKIKKGLEKISNNWFLQIFNTNFALLWKRKAVYALGVTFIVISSLFIFIHIMMGTLSPDLYTMLSTILGLVQLILSTVFLASYIILSLLFLFKEQAENDIHNIELRSGVRPSIILLVRYLVFISHGLIVVTFVFLLSGVGAGILASSIGANITTYIKTFAFYYFFLVFFSGISLLIIAICNKAISTLLTVFVAMSMSVAPLVTSIMLMISGDIDFNGAISSIDQRLQFGSKFYNYIQSENNKIFSKDGEDGDLINLFDANFFDQITKNYYTEEQIENEGSGNKPIELSFLNISEGGSGYYNTRSLAPAFASGMVDVSSPNTGTLLFENTWLSEFNSLLNKELTDYYKTVDYIFPDADQFHMDPLELVNVDNALNYLIKNSDKLSEFAKFIKDINKDIKQVLEDYQFISTSSSKIDLMTNMYSFVDYFTSDISGNRYFVNKKDGKGYYSPELLDKYEQRGIIWTTSQLWTMLFTATPWGNVSVQSGIPEENFDVNNNSNYNFSNDPLGYIHKKLASNSSLKIKEPVWVLDLIRDRQNKYSSQNKLNLASHMNFLNIDDYKSAFTGDVVRSVIPNLSGVTLSNVIELPEKGSEDEIALRNSLGWIQDWYKPVVSTNSELAIYDKDMTFENRFGAKPSTSIDHVIVSGIGDVKVTINSTIVAVIWISFSILLGACAYPIFIRRLRI